MSKTVGRSREAVLAFAAAPIAAAKIAGEEAGLQLSDPVPVTRPAPKLGCLPNGVQQAFIELVFVKPAELRVKPRERPDKRELARLMTSMARPNRIFRANARPRSASLCTSSSGSPAARMFVFRWLQHVRRKIRSPLWFAASKARRKRIAASPDMSRPRQDEFRSSSIRPGLKARQPALFHQVIAELTEPETAAS